jgi:hypothetical protein
VPHPNERTVEPHPNESVKLAMKILECRHKLRRLGWDKKTVQGLQEEIARLSASFRLGPARGAW